MDVLFALTENHSSCLTKTHTIQAGGGPVDTSLECLLCLLTCFALLRCCLMLLACLFARPVNAIFLGKYVFLRQKQIVAAVIKSATSAVSLTSSKTAIPGRIYPCRSRITMQMSVLGPNATQTSFYWVFEVGIGGCGFATTLIRAAPAGSSWWTRFCQVI